MMRCRTVWLAIVACVVASAGCGESAPPKPAAAMQTRKTIKQTTQNVLELSDALAQGGVRADLSIQGQGLEVAAEAYRTSVGKLSIIAVDQKMSFFEAETGRKP